MDPATPFPPIVYCSLPLQYFSCPPTWGLRLLIDLHVSETWDLLNEQCISELAPTPLPPYLSRISPLPLCVIASFFRAAFLSSHAAAFMGSLLGLVGAFVTVTWLEASRKGNQDAVWVVRIPFASWLAAQAVSAGLVLNQLQMPWIVGRDKFLRRGVVRKIERKHFEEGNGDSSHAEEKIAILLGRELTGGVEETYSLPLAIGLGYFVPSVILMVYPSTSVILAWQVFPVYIAVLRRFIMPIVTQSYFLGVTSPDSSSLNYHHPESHTNSLLRVYTLPVIFSITTHLHFLRVSLLQENEPEILLTRDATGVLVLDFWLIIVTGLIWFWREGGFKVLGVVIVLGVVAGPGTGVCVGWILREKWLLEQVKMKKRC